MANMKLSNLKEHNKAKIKSIKCDEELTHRLHSFGIFEGDELYVENISLLHNTIAINVDNSKISLRLQEAELIEVELIDG